MSELKRLLESSDNAEVRRLLRCGMADRPRRHAVERALVGLGAAGSVVSAAASVSASTSASMGGVAVGSGFKSSTITAAVLAKWFAIGIASGTVVGGSAGFVEHELGQPAPKVAVPAVQPHLAPAQTRVKASARAAASPATASPVVLASAPVATAREPSATAVSSWPPAAGFATTKSNVGPRVTVVTPPNPVPPSASSSSPERGGALPSVGSLGQASAALREEVELIDAARRAVAERQVPQAASVLERYARTRVTGVLDREAELLNIQLLELEGHRDGAARLARSYVARHPADANALGLRQKYGLDVEP